MRAHSAFNPRLRKKTVKVLRGNYIKVKVGERLLLPKQITNELMDYELGGNTWSIKTKYNGTGWCEMSL